MSPVVATKAGTNADELGGGAERLFVAAEPNCCCLASTFSFAKLKKSSSFSYTVDFLLFLCFAPFAFCSWTASGE